ncbi:hypothetical protein GGI07_004191 [Coemansia sp. Benny D115]|nr:hypothetical protein GGI07_004191 [Coemansia sp. Benny D115]
MPTALTATRPQHSKALVAAASGASAESLAARLKMLHQKASRALVLGQGAAAWASINEAVQFCNLDTLSSEYGQVQARQLCCRLWILHICVLSSLAEVSAEGDGRLRAKSGGLAGFPTGVREVWKSVVGAFGGYAGSVDSEVLVPVVLLCLKLRDARSARDVVEEWLATLPDDFVELLNDPLAENRSERASYMRVCELYTLHILPQLSDFDSAYEFLSLSTVVQGPAKAEYVRRLDSLRSPPPLAARKTKKPKKTSAKPKSVQSGRPASGDELQQTARTIGQGNKEKALLSSPSPSALSAHQIIPVNTPADRQKKPSSSAAAAAAATPIPRAFVSESSVARQQNQMHQPPAARRQVSRTKTRAMTHQRPRTTVGVAWQVVRRLVSRWGLTVFTLAIVVAVLRMVTLRFRLPPLLNALSRRLWNTFKMGTKVTYI